MALFKRTCYTQTKTERQTGIRRSSKMDIAFHTASDLAKFKEEIISILYRKYEEEMKHFPFLNYMSKDKFQSYTDQYLAHTKIVLGMENERITGVLLYHTWNKCGEKHIDIPVCGYGACAEDEDKMIGKLFQYMAQNEAAEGITNFSVHIYAHDFPARQLFSFMQFGTMSEICIRKAGADHEKSTPYRIQNLTKSQITENWSCIWALTKNIIDHLKESPVFYKGDEFTEETYRAFYLDENTTVYAAYDDSGEMIGIIESNGEENSFVCAGDKSVNVGEVYVLPEYRRSGLAQDLLFYAENSVLEQGAAFMWVEHGTANPNARGFWNRYFDTYQYEMIRQVVW